MWSPLFFVWTRSLLSCLRMTLRKKKYFSVPQQNLRLGRSWLCRGFLSFLLRINYWMRHEKLLTELLAWIAFNFVLIEQKKEKNLKFHFFFIRNFLEGNVSCIANFFYLLILFFFQFSRSDECWTRHFSSNRSKNSFWGEFRVNFSPFALLPTL